MKQNTMISDGLNRIYKLYGFSEELSDERDF